ncbi:MAG: hypothetical protein KJ667_09205 [Alphaproteobacteria bacterium]|nr:hypothetical protein [Alphaproteobacteria bacterium]
MNNHTPPLKPRTEDAPAPPPLKPPRGQKGPRVKWRTRIKNAIQRDPLSFALHIGFILLVIGVFMHEADYLYKSSALGTKSKSTFVVATQAPFLFRYDIFPPQENIPGKFYPLVVVLRDMDQPPYAARALAQPALRERFPAFVLVPRMPKRALWATPDDPRINLDAGAFSYPDTLPTAMAMIGMVVQQYPIDPTRLYLVGDKTGGVGAYAVLETAPGLFAGAIITAGIWTPETLDSSRTPLRAFHGGRDDVFDPALAAAQVRVAKLAGADAEFTLLPDSGHNIDPKIFETEALWQWLFKQKRPGTAL